MKTTDNDTLLIENYLGLIKNLSPNAKRNLIKKLTKTLTLNFSDKEKSVKDAFGAWESKKSADEIIVELRNSRNLNRIVEQF